MEAESSTFSPFPSPSSFSNQCQTCNLTTPKYTCPRCSYKSCSAACSNAHKVQRGCSGIRDKVKYIPPNKYSWGSLMDDYTFLEEVGRVVGGVGGEIVRGGIGRGLGRGRGSGSGRGRGRGRGGARGGAARSKKDLLKMQLGFKDTLIEFLPDGMEKRRLNQSTWDTRDKRALLTIEFIFHPPRLSSTQPDPYQILTHRNTLITPLLTILKKHISERRTRKDATPEWIDSMLTNTAQSVFLIAQYPAQPPLRIYHALDPSRSLDILLRHKSFLEWPTIEVWREGEFDGTIVQDVSAAPKVNPVSVMDLVGDYGSEDEVEEGIVDEKVVEELEEEEEAAFKMIGDYESDEEDEEVAGEDDEDDEDEEPSIILRDHEPDPPADEMADWSTDSDDDDESDGDLALVPHT